MKGKKRRNIGFIAFLAAVLIVAVYCAVCVNIEKKDLNEICELCGQKQGTDPFIASEFSIVAFYKNEFRGIYNDVTLIMAEKKDGKWTVTDISSDNHYYYYDYYN